MSEIWHHGILGMKWGVRRFQNKDGSLTAAGRKRYLNDDGSLTKKGDKELNDEQKKRLSGIGSRYSGREIKSERDAIQLIDDLKSDKELSAHLNSVLEQNPDLNKNLTETHSKIQKTQEALRKAYDDAVEDYQSKYGEWDGDGTEEHWYFQEHNPKYAKAYDDFMNSMKQYYADCRKVAAKLDRDVDIPKHYEKFLNGDVRGFDTTLVYTISKYADDHPIRGKYDYFWEETSNYMLGYLMEYGMWATVDKFGFNPFEEE